MHFKEYSTGICEDGQIFPERYHFENIFQM